MTIFLAGHETTANALQLDVVSAQRARRTSRRGCTRRSIACSAAGLPTLDDLPTLPFVEQVVTESMRLYPPAWIIGRRAIERLRDRRLPSLPARSIVVFSPYLIHRDARFFPEPDRFLPERWTPEFKASLPPFAYLPFGGGARRCIGESFAWMELVLWSPARSRSAGSCGSCRAIRSCRSRS